jgi:anti-sigma B factor antagonist
MTWRATRRSIVKMPAPSGQSWEPEERSVELEGLTMRAERTGDLAVITVAGELNMTNANALDQELERAEGAGVARIVLDLRGLDFVDSTGVRVLYEASTRSGGTDRLRVIRPSAKVQRVLDTYGLGELFPFVD